ncbi:cellulose biosynthesis cyclic di-GMP-binding regulatory protein BcsB [Paracoccus litorisediminis]|uniref:cellulose biosynthesis cyclic di-GMP-binding regulatory protein BcsB n=1 Tax=Paracoccus litorisediminis TaxID=2006130 RepID=UPI003733ACB4
MTPRARLSPGGVALMLSLLASTAFAQAVPEIQIAPPEAVETAPVEQPESVPVPIPAQRDATAPLSEAPDRKLLLTLRPPPSLPHSVVMGTSLPEPGVVRLTGETATSEFVLWLPDGVPLPPELVLSVRSSINVLADTAGMQVTINGATPVELPLNKFDGFGTLRVPAPDLVPGPNRIALSLRQPHRIFCGPDASFDVWTEIELTRSGAEYPVDALVPNADLFSLAVGNQISAGRPVNLLADPGIEPAALRGLATALGGAMQGQGQVNIQSFYMPTARNSATVALIPSDRSLVSYRQDANGAPVLQVESANGALPDLGGVLLPDTMPQAAPPPMLTPGQTSSLADLGGTDLIGNTHYYRHDFRFRLPSDWLLLANQKAHLDLQYGFADDLPKGAMLLVKVNDETIRLLPLDRNGGRIVDPLTIPFGARLLNPGQNTLSFEMMVPGDPADAACAPRRTDMLVVTKETTIEVPKSPAMQLSGITSPLSTLTPAGITVDPQAIDAKPLDLFATQLAAGLTPSDQPDDQVSLSLVDIAGLRPSDAGIPTRVLQEALFPVEIAPVAKAAPVPAAPQFRLSEESEPAPDAEPTEAKENAKEPAWSFGGWLSGMRERVRNSAFMTSDQDLGDWLQGRKGDALLMSGHADQPEALRLIVGPDAQANAIGPALNKLRTGSLGEGKAVLLSNDGTYQVWASAQLPRMREAVTPLNLLPVLGNYASWSPFIFTLGLLVLGLISIIPALLIVVLFRKRRLR